MIVYGDLLFLVNFSMDFLCFYFSCLLLHKKMPMMRVLMASAVGGIYSVISLFLRVSEELAFLLDLLSLFLMCVIVYYSRGLKTRTLFKAIALYFIVSALLGGTMTAIFSLLNRLDFIWERADLSDGIDVWVFSLLAILGSMVTLNGGRIFRSFNSAREAKLKIESENGSVILRALVDSGNLATEPISGKAVAFVKLEACEKLLTKEECECFSGDMDISLMPLHIASKIRIIPGKTVSGELYLVAIKFNKVSILDIKKEIDVYVAFVKSENLS